MKLAILGDAAALFISVTLVGCSPGSGAGATGLLPGEAGANAPPNASIATGPDASAEAGDGAAGGMGDASAAPDGPDLHGDAGAPEAHSVKWNPGHYMASGSILYPGSSLLTFEMDNLNGQDAFVGYRMLITWAALEPTEGNYDFSLIDAALARLESHYDRPKRLVVVVLPGAFTRTAPGSNDWSILPEYIQTNSAYGPSPVSGRYGWWGGTGNGKTYAACLQRPAIMDRWKQLHQALGAKYDSEPYFEALMFQEDSWVIGAMSTNGCPDYSDAAIQAGFRSLLTATVAAFPHTSVIFENTWMGTVTPTQQFEQWMIENRVAPGTADTFGQSYVSSHAGAANSWGLDAYFGQAAAGSSYQGPDYRPIARAMLDVEGPDLSAYGFKGYLPLDICNALNQSYKASHAFWTYLSSNSGAPVESLWPALAATCAANPLVNTAYPSNYP
jgi:hypothetical protein